MKRRTAVLTLGLIVLAVILSVILFKREKQAPVILLRSGWQVENIGDIAHTPGFLALAEQYIPEATVIFWPYYGLLPESEVAMLMKRFPKLTIVEGTLSDAGEASTPELTDALARADIFVHNSGPSMLSWKEALTFKKMTGKPFGVYGVTYGLYGTPENEALSEAAFVYFRDTVSLERAKQEGIHCPIMEWAPDAAFAADVTDEAKALAYLQQNGLEAGKYICCIPNQRRTPFWEHTFKKRPFDQAVQHLNESMKEHDHAPMIAAIVEIVRQTDLKVLIVHEDETELSIGKDWILDKLPEAVKPRVVWRSTLWTVDEAISIYKHSVGLFSHEMHSPIMCIGNGVPAIVVRWEQQSSKGTMWKTIGLDRWLFDFDKEEDVERYVPTVLDMAKNPAMSKMIANQAKAFVNNRQKETMEVIKNTMKSNE
jgi:polysaccharide pyruvyl transferase WcaK-like protein